MGVDLSRPTIYGLCDPHTSRIRYIGQSINVLRRYKRHLWGRGNSHRERWIQKLLAQGTPPLLMIIDQCDDSMDLRPLEIMYIAAHQPDLNVDDGTKAAALLGVPKTEAHRRAIGNAQRGKPGHFTGHHHTASARDKVRQAKLGKKLSPEHIIAAVEGRRRSAALRGASY